MDKDFINVYLFHMNEIDMRNVPIPEWRRKEIKKGGSEGLEKKEMLYIWGALYIAFKDCFKESILKFNPRKLSTGKMIIDKYHLSISHSGQYLMVGLSNENIGVDVQKFRESAAGNFMTDMSFWSDDEQKELNNHSDDWFYGMIMWTRKEALYKYLDPGYVFKDNHSKVDTTKYWSFFKTSTIDCKGAWFTVCSELISKGIDIVYKSNLLD